VVARARLGFHFLRAHARLAAASSSPIVVSWTITERAATSELDLTVDNAPSHINRPPWRNVVRIALPDRWTAETRSWDGILCVELAPCSYALVNPLSAARTVVPAPALREDERRCFVRGYIAGAYSHPVTGIFHPLHCTSQATGRSPRAICLRLLRVDGASASAWREIPMSADADTATLQTTAGHNFCASSATVHGRLHWRDMLRGQKELLVFDTVKEESGSMPLPQQLAGDTVVVQQTITTMSGKLCLLLGLAERTVEVWVLEDYRAQEWWLRQRLLAAGNTPLHTVCPSSYLGNVGLITAEDRVEKMVFCNGWRWKVYDVRRESSRSEELDFRSGIAIHTESPAPHDVVFGAAPTRGVALSSHPNPNNNVA
ncbi:hypothetical protein BAE44_0019091, partial [Dichanthelium oligosanthes]